MSTPQPSKAAPRRSTRKTKQPTVAISDNESSQYQDGANDAEIPGGNQNSRRKPQPKKKTGVPNNHAGVFHERPMTTGTQPEKTKATPIKQAYAGPTFHQSPAASALPMPSFYSKSVPNVSAPRASHVANDSGAEQSDSNVQPRASPAKREATPLDFLFEAARQARGTPRAESPSARSMNLSVTADSPVSRSPAPREPESVFPFELDGASTPGEDGTAFATPYKDRLESLKTTRSTSDGVQGMDEMERKAKTDALKKLLMHAHNQQRPAPEADTGNPFNARTAPSRNQLEAPRSQIRHRSGPSTPVYMQNHPGPAKDSQYFPPTSGMPYNGPHQTSPNRPPSSGLRNVYGPATEPEPAELSSDSQMPTSRISTARSHGGHRAPQSTSGGQALPPRNYNPLPSARPTPSAQQLEDDLRRVLKLDLTSQG